MVFIKKFKETIKKHRMIQRFDNILIGVSGGPDSVALLYALKAIQKEFNLNLHIAHLNHMLRGSESKEDARFVQDLAGRFDLPFTLKKIDIYRLHEKGSQEEIARRARLGFLLETARKIKADKIALGHNRDDQSETVIMRILRGSGLLGLTGILPKRQIHSFIIIRPLIEIPRRDIEKFLRHKRITPRRDSSNSDETYFRNRIRGRLLPELEKYNPKIRNILANTAENLALDYDYLLKLSLKVFNRLRAAKRNKPNRVKLSLDKLLKLHPCLQNMAFRLGFEALKGDTRRLAYQHIKELRDLILNRPNGAIVDLPSGISACKTEREITFSQ